jgi:hypothetical protein
MGFKEIINDFLNILPGCSREMDARVPDTFGSTGKDFTGSPGTRSR